MAQSDRYLPLDRMRVGAMALVVLGHSAVAYTTTPIGWAIQDRRGLLAADGLAWIAHAFLMPVFFWIAGFALYRSLAAHGMRRVLTRRLLGVAVPLAVLVVPVSLAMSAIWRWGARTAAHAAVVEQVPRLDVPASRVTLVHLWYLYYLLLYTLAAVAWWWLRHRRPAARATVVASERWPPVARFAVIAGSVALVLAAAGKLQVDTPLRFVPNGPALALHGIFFATGWVEAQSPDATTRWAWVGQLAIAMGLFGVLVPRLLDAAAGRPTPAWTFVASALVTSLLVAAFVGAHRHRGQPLSPAVRRLADASFWCYVVHLPVVCVAQIALFPMAAPAAVKLAAVFATGVAVSLATWVAMRGVVGRRAFWRR